MKFKEEYEGLNGKENSFGSKYPTVEIDEDNIDKSYPQIKYHYDIK